MRGDHFHALTKTATGITAGFFISQTQSPAKKFKISAMLLATYAMCSKDPSSILLLAGAALGITMGNFAKLAAQDHMPTHTMVP